MRSLSVLASLIALVTGILFLRPAVDLGSRPSVLPSLDAAGANRLMNRQPGFFVPNLGQWEHPARFVHRSGTMTLFLEDRGWVIDVVQRSVEPDHKTRGVALQMTFEGDAGVPEIIGEKKLDGHHNYFLGKDESRWRSHVPLYGSVRYENLYPGIDLRLREANGVPEYDLLLQPGADLVAVCVRVEGGQSLSIAKDGSLVIETALGPVTQSQPRTWQVDGDGRRREVVCNFTLLGAERFGFEAPGWDGDTSLTIDPDLVWSTYLGGGGGESANAFSVDGAGVVTVAGQTSSIDFPTTTGAYDSTYNNTGDAFVSRLDPQKTGTAQLLYSTYLGGSSPDQAYAVDVDASGVVAVAGETGSADFPVTSGAYDTTHNGPPFGSDVFVSRLDPTKTGGAQLVYSTFLGGGSGDIPRALYVDAAGVVTLAGETRSSNFPMTTGAYDTSYNKNGDAFVSRLDSQKTGSAQLVYSTFLGGNSTDYVYALAFGGGSLVAVAGETRSPNFPATTGAYDVTFNGIAPNYYPDAFVTWLDLSKTGASQLSYSTFLGGTDVDHAYALHVDAKGTVVVAGETQSTKFPTKSAYDRTYNTNGDAFVSQLDLTKSGTAQLVYSTYLGGTSSEYAYGLSVDAGGMVTVAGFTGSTNFPVTSGAFSSVHNGPPFGDDAFVTRLDPSKKGSKQLVYSTFLGGNGYERALALRGDASGGVTVAGITASSNFPTTSGAYDSIYNGGDAFITRLSMGAALYANVHEIPINSGGTQSLQIDAGKGHANLLYWIFGSATGTTPGIDVLGVHIPLNPDAYTNVAMATVNTPVFTNFRGALDINGLGSASLIIPPSLPIPPGYTLYHAYVVFVPSGKFFMASNAVPIRFK